MKNCNIPWGAHTMVYKEFVIDDMFYICKTIRKSDSQVCFGIHQTNNDHVVVFNYSMIISDSEYYDENEDKLKIDTLKGRLYNYLSEKTGYSVEKLKSCYS